MSRCVMRRFSTGSGRGWNSSTGLIITNPIQLKMESCSSMAQLKQIQAQMKVTGLIRDAFPASRVLSFCALSDAGDFGYPLALFDRVNDRNLYVWNTMVQGWVLVGGVGFVPRDGARSGGGVELDQQSIVFGLKACERVLAGNSVNCRVVKVSFDRNLLVMNGMIHFYGEKGETFDAWKLFDGSLVRDVVCWTSMIDRYAKKGCLEEALGLFERMLVEGVESNEGLVLGKSIHRYVDKSSFRRNVNLSNALLDMYVKCDCLDAAREVFDRMGVKDTFSWTSLVNGYAKCGQLESARRMFNAMPERNVVSWNAIIAGYSQNNLPNQAIDLFHDMVVAGLDPVEGSLVCVLSACTQSGCLDFGRRMHQFYVEERRMPSIPLMNAFLDMYSKCGDIDAAAAVFDEIPCKDLVSWNSMIVGYASHGYAEQALLHFNQMISTGIKPDDITCWAHFRNLEPVWGLRPKVEHYACMIDLLGRTGRLKEAYELMIRMPMEPDIASWGALLNASRMHGNVELGKLAAEKLMRWDDVKLVRSMMRERAVKKTPGCSSIAVDGVVHEFLAADESHPQSSAIYEALDQMRLQAKIQPHWQQ
uniref:Uncharacterized protein n=1 Tax=Kalanchoe fedtschenkoi TaxID=63787 RepID=A0A7N0UCU7_KALFE